jgi:ParB family chromosome partitioning protein
VTSENRKLKNIDELIASCANLGGGVNPYRQLDITSLVPFANHPFALYTGERLEDMVDSTKANGILVPIIVRVISGTTLYEILSGHNRVHAGKIVGLLKIHAIVLENITDEEAMAYVVETNLMQRSFAEMSHTEKATVIAMHHSKMFSQGKRNDILSILSALENNDDLTFYQSGKELGSDGTNGNTGEATLYQSGKKLRSHEAIGEKYSLSKNTVARYIRIHKLTEPLKKRLDNDEIGFIPAVTLSYLTAEEQLMVNTYFEAVNVKIDVKKAELLRKYSNQGILDQTSMAVILVSTELKDKTTSGFTSIKVKPSLLEKYFHADESVEKIEEVFELALEYYFKSHADNVI